MTITSFGQGCEKKTFKISKFKFHAIFGTTKLDRNAIYCFLGSVFFRASSSGNIDSLITDWIIKHKNAIVIPVSSYGPSIIDTPDSRMVFCIAVQGGDTLNNYLVKNGNIPGSTMIRPKTWNEMGKREKELYDNSDKGTNVKVLMDKKEYETFLKQIKNAEAFARERKLGVWAEDYDD